MNLHTIDTGLFKLDGGAMFGVVPKSIWNRLNPSDENNMCTWAMRCLLVEEGDRLILVDTGIGGKQDDKFFSYYYLTGDDTLEKSLNKKGFTSTDITDVFLTHLHFDHVGGAVQWNRDHSGFECAFPNAVYWSNERHWNHALNPNVREKPSFLKENLLPIQESGQLKFLNEGDRLMPGFDIIHSFGHTEDMMLPKITKGDKTLVYMADLVPSHAHVPVNFVMGYDIRPLNAMSEKEKFYEEALAGNYVLMFEHDPVNECGLIKMTDRGVRLDTTLRLSEAI